MSEKQKEVEKMIAKVMRKKDLTRNDAIDYMLVVATGRLAALWRYDESVPEGKKTKGILTLAGPRKKRAPKTPKIVLATDGEPAKPAKKPAAKRVKSDKPAKTVAKKRAKKAAKPAKTGPTAQLEISAAE